MGVLWSFFVFGCGFLFALVFLAFAIYLGLLHLSTTVAKQKEELLELARKEQQEEKKWTANANHSGLGETRSHHEHNPSKKTWIKILTKEDDETTKQIKPKFVTLHQNMLLPFADSASNMIEGTPIRVDDVEVTVKVFRKPGKPVWKETNPIILICDRALWHKSTVVYLYFRTAKDLEEWYYSLTRASRMAKMEAPEQRKQREFWADLSKKLNNFSMHSYPDYLVAVITRIFWMIHDSDGFLVFLLKRIRKKLDKIEKPSFVHDISCTSIGFGPRLPILKSIQLQSMSPEGEVQLEGEFVYHGGFHVRLQVVFVIQPAITGKKYYLPCAFTVTLEKLEGKAHVSIGAPPSDRFWLGFYGEPTCDLKIEPEIGEYKFAQLPMLANMIVNKIKSEFIKMMVLPKQEDWPLPKFPKPKKELAKENSTVPEEISQKKEKETFSSPLQSQAQLQTPTTAQTQKEKEKQLERDIQLQTKENVIVGSSGTTQSPQPPVLSAKAANSDSKTFNSLNQSVTDLVNLMDENKKTK